MNYLGTVKPVRSGLVQPRKKVEGCHQCNDFPCKFIENFPLPVGKKVILRAIPTWKELGTVKWMEDRRSKVRRLSPQQATWFFIGWAEVRNWLEHPSWRKLRSKTLLKVPANFSLTSLIAVGHPNESPKRERKPVDQVLEFLY